MPPNGSNRPGDRLAFRRKTPQPKAEERPGRGTGLQPFHGHAPGSACATLEPFGASAGESWASAAGVSGGGRHELRFRDRFVSPPWRAGLGVVRGGVRVRRDRGRVRASRRLPPGGRATGGRLRGGQSPAQGPRPRHRRGAGPHRVGGDPPDPRRAPPGGWPAAAPGDGAARPGPSLAPLCGDRDLPGGRDQRLPGALRSRPRRDGGDARAGAGDLAHEVARGGGARRRGPVPLARRVLPRRHLSRGRQPLGAAGRLAARPTCRRWSGWPPRSRPAPPSPRCGRGTSARPEPPQGGRINPAPGRSSPRAGASPGTPPPGGGRPSIPGRSRGRRSSPGS